MVKLFGLLLMVIGWVLLSKRKGGLILSGVGIGLLTL